MGSVVIVESGGTEFDSVKAHLLSAGYPVYDGEAVNADGKPFTGSYFVLYGGNLGGVGDDRLSKGQDAGSDREIRFTVRAVSVSASGARNLDRVGFTVLVGWVPSLTGRVARPVRFDGSDGAVLDDSVMPAVWFADSDYVFTSTR